MASCAGFVDCCRRRPPCLTCLVATTDGCTCYILLSCFITQVARFLSFEYINAYSFYIKPR